MIKINISPKVGNNGDEMPFDPSKAYNDLSLLRSTSDLQTYDVLKALLPAVRAMDKLSATADALPNPEVLPETEGLLEAQASSEIENIVTTSDQLFLPKSLEHIAVDAAKEVRRYAQAVKFGWEQLADRPMDTPLAETICSIIKNQQMMVRRVPGTSLQNTITGEVVYTPPVGEQLLQRLLSNLFIWLHTENDIDPIVKAAVLHYQFVAIHPFTDGNGRTARILTVLYLVEQRALSAPVLFLSGPILSRKDEYYEIIQRTTESGDFEPYLLWFIEIIKEAAIQSNLRGLSVELAINAVSDKVHRYNSRFHSEELISFLFMGPFITAQDMVDANVAGSLTTAYRYLDNLVSAGVIELYDGPNPTRKHKIYINPEFLDSLAVTR